MRPLRVAKFGGTSVADAQSMRRSAALVDADVVVVSATAGTTNLLDRLAKDASTGEWASVESGLRELSKRHLEIAAALRCEDAPVRALVREAEALAQGMHLLREQSPRARDGLLSIGEQLSSYLFAQLLQAQLFDARTLIRTDACHGRAAPQIDLIAISCRNLLMPLLGRDQVIVTQGFVGSNRRGITTTLGRGGSDFSAALLAEAIGAAELMIWTDVDGIASADPRMIPEAKTVSEISFAEASELARLGARVLHPATLTPAMRCDIPVFIGSTLQPELGGTWIRRRKNTGRQVRAISLRRSQVLVTLHSPAMLGQAGFLARVFEILARHALSVDLVTTSEVNVSLTIDNPELLGEEVLEELRAIAKVDVEKNLTLVAVVGDGINEMPGMARAICANIDCNIRLICQGASTHNFCLLIPDDQAEPVLRKLHEQLIERREKEWAA